MSDDFHRPTYTDKYGGNDTGQYNPTQVRLYGIAGLSDEDEYSADGINIAVLNDSVNFRIDLKSPEQAKKAIAAAQEMLAKVKANPKALWKKKGKGRAASSAWYFLELQMKLLGIVYLGAVRQANYPLSAGIMFGYAFEGHTYDFPKPKIMLVPAYPLPIPLDDSGYDKKHDAANDLGYRVWVVDKLDQCVDIEVNQGFVEQLVLEANMPGKRSPSAYRAAMMLAHRGGRLTD
jgi:hypothetical protein